MLRILTFNAGSSSLRTSLYRVGDGTTAMVWQDHQQQPPEQLGARLGDILAGIPEPADAVAHRVVHGGPHQWRPVRIDAGVEGDIEQACTLAPLHNPHALNLLRQVRDRLDPELPHIACFDTGFYHDLPAVAATYALPAALSQEHGLRRYGFHGLAHQAMLAGLSECHGGNPPSRVISLQLGGGCSVTASRDGRALDTSMGFTPLEGLVMGTRSGDLDPAVILYVMGREELGVADANALLNKHSGLQGLSGISSDMRDLLEEESEGSDRARLALDVYCYRVRKYIGAYAAVMGGVDAVGFTGGIGQNSPEIRARCLQGLGFLGVEVDGDANGRLVGGEQGAFQAGDGVLLATVRTGEELVIALEAERLAEAG